MIVKLRTDYDNPVTDCNSRAIAPRASKYANQIIQSRDADHRNVKSLLHLLNRGKRPGAPLHPVQRDHDPAGNGSALRGSDPPTPAPTCQRR